MVIDYTYGTIYVEFILNVKDYEIKVKNNCKLTTERHCKF